VGYSLGGSLLSSLSHRKRGLSEAYISSVAFPVMPGQELCKGKQSHVHLTLLALRIIVDKATDIYSKIKATSHPRSHQIELTPLKL
jgi:hypothetical protein